MAEKPHYSPETTTDVTEELEQIEELVEAIRRLSPREAEPLVDELVATSRLVSKKLGIDKFINGDDE